MPRRRPAASRSALALLLVSCGLSGPALATQLLRNGGIEFSHGLGKPLGWDIRSQTGTALSTTPSSSRTGTHALAINLSNGDNPEWAHAPVAIVPGEQYLAAFHYQVDIPFSTGGVDAYLRFYSDTSRSAFLGQTLIQAGIGSSATAGWQLAEATATAPPGAGAADVVIFGVGIAAGPQGRAFFDDFSLLASVPVTPLLDSVSPADGTEGTDLLTTMEWTPLQPADQYHVYLGTSYPEVAAAVIGDPAYHDSFPAPGGATRYSAWLLPHRQYFWRVDIETAGGTITPGRVRSFTTAFNAIEDGENALIAEYQLQDSRNLGMDTLQVIENPAEPGYLGVYHNIPENNGRFDIHLATSTDLVNWQYRETIAPNSSMPALVYLQQNDAYLLAHEQWINPNSVSPAQLRFQYFPSYQDLLQGNESHTFLAPISSSFNPSVLEGTPNFLDVDEQNDVVTVGFHYFNNGVDRYAVGELTGFLENASVTWSASSADSFNNLLIALAADANIGDRDLLNLAGQPYLVQEGQYDINDFGTWRLWFFDENLGNYLPLFPRTPGGSTASGNITSSLLPLPDGSRGVVTGAFIFAEGAGFAESGQSLIANRLQMKAWEPLPANAASVPADTNLTLRWQAAAGAERYDVYFGTDQDAVSQGTATVAAAQRPLFEATNLAPGQTFYWRVDSIWRDGTVVQGDVWNFTALGPSSTETWRVY